MRRSPQLARQWTLYDRDEHDRAQQQARTLLPRLRGGERQEAYRLIGLCCHRQQKHGEAVDWLKRACEGSEDSQVWLELALAALKAGDRTLSGEALEQVRLCQQAARYAQAPGFYLQLFWYAGTLLDAVARATAPPSQSAGRSSEVDRSVPALGDPAPLWEQLRSLLDELGTVYCRLYLTDTTFLYARQMPFLSSFLTLVTRYFVMCGQLADGVAWLKELSEALDSSGQEQVKQAIKTLRRAASDQKAERKTRRR